MNHYRKGYVFELETQHKLQKAGFYVMSSRGSHGLLDLIAFNSDYAIGFQLKNGCKITEKDQQGLMNLGAPKNFVVCAFTKDKKGKKHLFALSKTPVFEIVTQLKEILE
jgi:hypothetical protein